MGIPGLDNRTNIVTKETDMNVDVVFTAEITRLEMARVERKATKAWQFQHLRNAESQVLSTVWARVVGFFRKVVSLAKTDIAPAQERLSY
jgi:hypothetical protein